MKLFKLLLIVSLLAGCASSDGGSAGASQSAPSHAQAVAKIHTELASAYYERAQYGVALQEVGVALQADANYAPAYNVRALLRMALREDEQADADSIVHSEGELRRLWRRLTDASVEDLADGRME